MRIELHLPRPHSQQRRVITEARRFNVVDCGRRWGKTELGMDRIIEPALRGKPCAWFAPTYRDVTEVWSILISRLLPLIENKSEQKGKIRLKTGGSIEVWSLDSPDTGRGRAYARIVIDEAAKIAQLQEAWERTIRPMLMDYGGDAWFLSTPRGIANYFHVLYQRGQDATQPEWASWQMPTSSNPFIPEREIVSMRDELPELAFQQEALARFVTWEGQVFRCIADAVIPCDYTVPAAIIGVDWGRTMDYTVFTPIAAHGHVLPIERFRGIEYSLQRARLREFWQRVSRGKAWILAEYNSMGGPVVEQLQRDGLPVIAFQTTAASKSMAIEALALAFERGSIKIPDDPVMIGELQAFEGKPGPSGMMRYGAPAGMHDDTVMSLAIGWSGILAARDQTPSHVYLDPATGAYGTHLPPRVQISPI